jgi:hypothetical protein
VLVYRRSLRYLDRRVIQAPGVVSGLQPRVEAGVPRNSGRWLLGYVLLQLSCQLLLLVPFLANARLAIRIATFSAGLLFLVVIPRKGAAKVPIQNIATYILGLLVLEAFHPEGSTALGALAAVALNLAILAPVFWVPRVFVQAVTFQRVITCLWLYYTASATLGVLQSYFPGHFQPALSSVVKEFGRDVVASLEIKLSSGERMFRPMGLTDTPGGSAYGALFSVLLGTGVFVLPKSPFFGARVLAIGSMAAGMTCLFLCQIRSLLVMTGICMVTLTALLTVSGRGSRLAGLLAAVGSMIPPAFMLAASLGGRSMTDRLESLVEFDADTVYYTHRGYFLETTFNEYLPHWPLGAGLGRWGMLAHYFGTRAGYLWAEIQWTAWLFDGGLPLMILYSTAILTTTWACLQVARGRIGASEPSLSLWGAVLVAYNVGTIAECFSYVPFIGTAGIEFWLLNISLLCAAQNSDRIALGETVSA